MVRLREVSSTTLGRARKEGNLVRHNNNGVELARWKTRTASNFYCFFGCSKRMEGGGTEDFLVKFLWLDSNLEDTFVGIWRLGAVFL